MTTIEVFADVWCPFTHVGLRRLVERREARGSTVRLRVRAWPLELVNGHPLDAAFIGEEIADLRAQVAPDLFLGFDEGRFPASTLPALALTEAAYRVGEQTGEAMSLALRDALFEQGRNIGDAEVLGELAAALGVPSVEAADGAAVTTSLDEGRARGVVGSPHFFTPSGGFFCPALAIERVDGHLRITSDLEAFDRFAAGFLDG
jgi:predicted DsbA family dithiol-disulfide isomerase